MANFVARWFTPPSEKTQAAPERQVPKKKEVSPAVVGLGKQKTRSRYAGAYSRRTQDEAALAKKTLLGQ